MAAIYSNGGNRWNILGFNFTKRDALSSLYKIPMVVPQRKNLTLFDFMQRKSCKSYRNEIKLIAFRKD
jgi:hypothetical protein